MPQCKQETLSHVASLLENNQKSNIRKSQIKPNLI